MIKYVYLATHEIQAYTVYKILFIIIIKSLLQLEIFGPFQTFPSHEP